MIKLFLNCGFELVTREFKFVTSGFELVTCKVEFITRKFELGTHLFIGFSACIWEPFTSTAI